MKLRVDKIVAVLAYVVEFHEWCCMPMQECEHGHRYSQPCNESSKEVCEGCEMMRLAKKLLRRLEKV